MDDATNPAPRPLPEPVPTPTSAPPSGPAGAPADHLTRRWFLAVGGALAVGAGAGTAAAFLHPERARKRKPPARPPADLAAALDAAVAAERGLLADLDATSGGAPAVRRVIAQARADHAAHLRALRRVQVSLPKPAHRPARREVHGMPRTQAQLRSAETAASVVAAKRAAGLDGAVAVLLASIAACEATHAELLR
jgi:hypothetical protein